MIRPLKWLKRALLCPHWQRRPVILNPSGSLLPRKPGGEGGPIKRAEDERIRCDAATLICCALARIQFPAFTSILSLLLRNSPIYEPFFLPSPPVFLGRGVGGEGESASRRPSGPKLHTWSRVPTLVPLGQDLAFDGAAPSSPALLPREARGRREQEGFKIHERCYHCERNESGLRHVSRFISPGRGEEERF